MDRPAELKSRFALIDTNSNGSLEKSELSAVFGEHAAEFLKFCDNDSDGSLTSEEFVNGIMADTNDMPDDEFQTNWLDRMTQCIADAKPAQAAAKANPLKIGATLPDYAVKTTKGDFSLHTYFKGEVDGFSGAWTCLFTHPADFTPVCTTELGQCHILAPKFAALDCKLLGISCDSVESHNAWSADVLSHVGSGDDSLAFPIVADDRTIVSELGMLDPEERDAQGVPMPARALVILHGTTVKLNLVYPATTGRNFDEVLRVLTSLQMTANLKLATPVNWKYGERVVCTPPLQQAEIDEKGYTGLETVELPSGKPYLRKIDCPEKGQQAP